MSWRNTHYVVGAVGLLLFVLQGQYMLRVLGVENLADGPRMMYRTAHLYLMLACVANITLASIPTDRKPTISPLLLCRLLLLLAVPLLIWSFFFESMTANLDRPVTKIALYGMFGAGVLLLLGEALRRVKNRQSSA